jgi:hypothetical protein
VTFPPEPPEPVYPPQPAMPAGPPPYGWNTVPTPRRRGRGPLVALVVAVATVVLAGAVAAAVLLGRDGSTDRASGRLKTPIRFQQVMAETPGSCPGTGTPSSDHQICYRLVPGGMTVTRVKAIGVMSPDAEHGLTSWGIDLGLEPVDARAFEQLSAKAAAAEPEQPGNKIAMVVNGAVISAPTVAQPIAGGRIQITGSFDQRAAKRLFHQLIGADG